MMLKKIGSTSLFSCSLNTMGPSVRHLIPLHTHTHIQVSHDAILSSPFYRHYGMFHLASDSQACPDVADELEKNSSSSSSHYTIKSRWPLPENWLQNVTVPRKGFLSGLLGTRACFCGFSSAGGLQGTCQLPSVIIEYLRLNLPETTSADEARVKFLAEQQLGAFSVEDNPVLQRVLSEHWIPEKWPCPELEFSDHWGFVRNGTAWRLSQEKAPYELLANDYLEKGFGGIRAGTLKHVMAEATHRITPAARRLAGASSMLDGSPVTGHTKCTKTLGKMRPESLADRFVNDLFPAAQAVVDAPAVSYCMRYAIELARSNVVALLTSTEAVSVEQVRCVCVYPCLQFI